MASVTKWGKRGIALGAGAAATALVLTGCASGSVSSADLNGMTIGTTDKITSLDPAGSYDNGSFAVQNQVFPFLMNTPSAAPTSSRTSPPRASSRTRPRTRSP